MGTPSSDTAKRMDMTEMSDVSDRVPSPADRKVFLSGDYKDEQLRTEFGQRTCRLTAGLGAIVLGPIWYIWLGRILRNRATANPV